MSTRGVVGFIVKRNNKLTYNHSDSYPKGLGCTALSFLRGIKDWGALKIRVDNIVMVDENVPATDIQVEQLMHYANLGVSTRDPKDWYCLLRDTQGDLEKIIECGFMIDSQTFAGSSLHCEWGYLIDLDNDVFEVYRGFNKVKLGGKARFAYLQRNMSDSQMYFPIKKILSYSFRHLPDDAKFLKDVDREDDDIDKDEDPF